MSAIYLDALMYYRPSIIYNVMYIFSILFQIQVAFNVLPTICLR